MTVYSTSLSRHDTRHLSGRHSFFVLKMFTRAFRLLKCCLRLVCLFPCFFHILWVVAFDDMYQALNRGFRLKIFFGRFVLMSIYVFPWKKSFLKMLF
jgi:hypothetical protein